MCVTTLGKMHFRIYQLLLRVLEEKKNKQNQPLQICCVTSFHLGFISLY